MSDCPPTPAVMAADVSAAAEAQDTRDIEDIRAEFGNAVATLKQKYGRLMEEQERQIRELARRLAQGRPEEPTHRVLVVDDAESTVDLLKRYLESHPVEVVQVAAVQAQDALRAGGYDAVMIETACTIRPGVNGLMLCQQLCEGGEQKQIVAMSSRPGDGIQLYVEAAGAQFLRKPFGRGTLLKLMRGTLLKEKR